MAHMERADALGARFVALCEADYPPLLKHIDDAPPLLCVMGSAELAAAPTIAIVGARNASALGRKFARSLAHDLCAAGCTVVSGLARGIDTAAHEASVEHATCAVVAGGIDVIYPPENQELQERIAQHGLLVSEMFPGTRPQAQHFPRRNRLISGISLGVVVIEAAQRSGSLITARLALEQNRDVFAVPGNPLDPRAEGSNRLIRDGATLVRNADDVLTILSPMIDNTDTLARSRFEDAAKAPAVPSPTEAPEFGTSDTAGVIRQLLGTAPVEIDELIRESGLDAQSVMAVLLEFELAGKVERLPQQRVALVP